MKRVRKLVAASLVLAMLIGNAAFASGEELSDNDRFVAEATSQVLSQGSYEYRNAALLSRLVQVGYAVNQSQGPFFITKGKIRDYGWFNKETEVYVVCISGTDTSVAGQSTGVWTDLLSGFEFDNSYIKNVKKAMLGTIPRGANVLITGHSLGGMIAQQACSDDELKKAFNFVNTVTFGSPLINGFKREGTVKRLGDTSDVVPFLSLTTFTNVVWQSAGLNREDGGYSWKSQQDLLGAHCESYNREDVWGAYDITGTKNGNKSLILDFSTTRFFQSPVKVTE